MSLFFILKTFPPRFKGTVYRQFIDDVFLLFQTKNPFEKFEDYLNKQHKNKIYGGNWGKWVDVIFGCSSQPWKQQDVSDDLSICVLSLEFVKLKSCFIRNVFL